MTQIFHLYALDIWGLRDEREAGSIGRDYVSTLVEMLLSMRAEAKEDKNWALSDKIRDGLVEAGIRVKDRKDGCDWELE